MQTAERTDIQPHVRDGYIMMYIYLPAVFGDEFICYVAPIIPSILQVGLRRPHHTLHPPSGSTSPPSYPPSSRWVYVAPIIPSILQVGPGVYIAPIIPSILQVGPGVYVAPIIPSILQVGLRRPHHTLHPPSGSTSPPSYPPSSRWVYVAPIIPSILQVGLRRPHHTLHPPGGSTSPPSYPPSSRWVLGSTPPPSYPLTHSGVCVSGAGRRV